MKPEVILGGKFEDERGVLLYNNDFDASLVKRIYFIENASTEFLRGWQGHKIEERWFVAVDGTVKINLVKIDDWKTPSHDLESETFELDQDEYKVLHVPAGYVSCIQTMKPNTRLMVMSNYTLGEIKDEYRFPLETFKMK